MSIEMCSDCFKRVDTDYDDVVDHPDYNNIVLCKYCWEEYKLGDKNET